MYNPSRYTTFAAKAGHRPPRRPESASPELFTHDKSIPIRLRSPRNAGARPTYDPAKYASAGSIRSYAASRNLVAFFNLQNPAVALTETSTTSPDSAISTEELLEPSSGSSSNVPMHEADIAGAPLRITGPVIPVQYDRRAGQQAKPAKQKPTPRIFTFSDSHISKSKQKAAERLKRGKKPLELLTAEEFRLRAYPV